MIYIPRFSLQSLTALLRNEAKGWYDTKTGTILTDAAANMVAASSEYLSISDGAQSGLDLSGNFTISAWVKFNSVATGQGVLAKYGNAGNRSYYLALNSGIPQVAVSPNGTSVVVANGPSLSSGTWYHLAAVYNGSTLTLYTNGAAGTPVSHSSGVFNSSAPFEIGRITSGSYLGGHVALAAIWSRALSPAEISAQYGGLTYAGFSPANKANLASYWHLNEPSGVRRDAHGSNNLTDNNTVGVAAGPVEYAATEGAAITKWQNQGGNASPFGDLAIVVRGGVSLNGGKPTFTGSYLRTATGSLSQPASICVIYKRTGAAVAQHIIDSFAATGPRIAMVSNASGNQIYSGAFLGSGGAALNTREVAIGQFDGVTSERIINSDVDGGNAGTAGISGVSVGGGTVPFFGEIEGVILLDRKFTAAEISALKTL